MSKRIGRRSIAALLAAVMVFTTVPVSVSAAEAGADTLTEALTETPAEEETSEKQTEEQAPEEKDGKEDSSSYGSEEQAPENEEHRESSTEQTEDPAETGTVSENEIGDADEIVTEEGTEEAIEETKNKGESEIGEEAAIAEVYENNGGYPYSVAAGVYTADKWGFFQCECTSFVAYCLNERNKFSFWNTMYGSDSTNKWGNADHWGAVARLHGFTVDNNPAVGAVAWSSGGHVAWVSAVNGNTVTIEEYNYGFVTINGERHGNHLYNKRDVNKSAFQYIHFNDITSGHTPRGALDEVRGGAGSVFVRGWAMDDDLPYQSLTIHVYIGGPAGSGAPFYIISADKPRADIGYGNHGFEETISTDKTGVQDVYVYALDAEGKDDNPQIGKGTVTITDRVKGSYMDTGYAQTIPDGYYHIASSFGDKWWLTISGSSMTDGGNVEVADYSGKDFECDEHLFYFKFLDDGDGRGFYKITNKLSGKCLDVERASEYMRDENGNPTNVQQWEDNGSSAQQWAIREADGGEKGLLYTFKARNSGFCLDLFGGEDNLNNGIRNISMYEDNASFAQQWRLVPYAPAVGQTIEDGEYQIVYSTAENKAIGAETSDNGANILLSSLYREDHKQTFNIKYLGNGYYSIVNKYSGLSLDVAGVSRVRGTNVWLWWDTPYDAQRWIIQPCGNGYYNIISKCNGLYLNLDGAGATDGENINMWSWGTGNTIKWKFVPCAQSKLSTPTSTLSNTAEVDAGTIFYLNKNGADTLYFTWDGTTPTRQSAEYSDSEGLTIPTGQETCTLKAFGVKEGCQDSDVLEITYTVRQKKPSGEEGGSGEEGDSTPEDDDLQDGVKWHYNEEKVIYKDLSQYGQITTSIKPKTYDGTPYRPVVKVTAIENGKTITLTEGPDYRVLYFNNIHAGTGSVTVKGNGVYKGTISRTFEIKKKSCKKLKVVTGSMLTGDSRTPRIYVYDGSTLLQENKDYTLEGITPNLTATKGTKQISVIAAQNSDYEGMISAKITVYNADKGRIKGIIDSPENVNLSQSTYQYTGKACKPTAIVTVDGNTLTAGKDYTIKYRNNKDAGTAFATITGKGSYVGSVVKEFTIKSSNGEFTLKKPIAAVTYNGKLQKPKITVKVEGKTLKQNKDYTLSYANNLHATESAKVIVRGKGNYANVPTKVFRFTINPCHIKKVSVKGGQGSLLITHAKHTLVEGVDYDVVYGAAVGKGKISVTIKAKEGSSFTGEITKKVKQ